MGSSERQDCRPQPGGQNTTTPPFPALPGPEKNVKLSPWSKENNHSLPGKDILMDQDDQPREPMLISYRLCTNAFSSFESWEKSSRFTHLLFLQLLWDREGSQLVPVEGGDYKKKKKKNKRDPQSASEVCTEGRECLVLSVRCSFIHDSAMSKHSLGDSVFSFVKWGW